MHFSQFLTASVNWIVENGLQGNLVLSSMLRREINADMQAKTVRNWHRKRQNFDNFPMHGQVCGFGEHCCEISSVCKGKMPQIDPELPKSLKLCRFWCNFCTISERFLLSNKINSTTIKRPMHYIFWRERCSVLIQNTLETLQRSRKNSTSSFMCKILYFLNRFGVRRMANVQQRLNW